MKPPDEFIFLSAAPLTTADSSAHPGLESLELYREEKNLGSPDSPIRIKEGTITCGDPKIIPISREKVNFIGSENWDFYLVYMPFTLHKTPENRYYEELEVYFALDDKKATACDLYPKNITRKEEVEKTIGLSFDMKFKDIGIKLGDFIEKLKFEQLEPVISAFGEGESAFYWKYTSVGKNGVIPETKYTLMSFKVPRGKKKLSGKFYYQATMGLDWLGTWMFKKVNSDQKTFSWPLTDK